MYLINLLYVNNTNITMVNSFTLKLYPLQLKISLNLDVIVNL